MKNKERIIWITITTLLAFLVFSPLEKARALSREAEKYLQIFHEISTLIETDYVESIEEKEIYIGAIKGMLGSLGDAHTRFMQEEDFKQLQEETRGSFGGVGLEVTQSEGTILVISPIDDTPAQKAGLMPQDRILEINGTSTQKMSIQDAVKLMRGPSGTNVTIKVRRKSVKDPFLVTLTREQIKIQFLKSTFLDDENIGYIRLSQFMGRESTSVDFRRIVSEFVEKKPKGIIIDLRSNPGGLLDLAIDLCDLFLPSDVDIVSVKGRGEKLIKVYKSTMGKDKITDLPMVVLVNGGSASASEIFAGAMQDHKRGKILGTQSFGKGSVQNIYPLSHKTGIALTIQKYYTPSGVSIHKKGITPDLKINPLTPDDEERLHIDKILKTKLLANFVKDHPNYDEKSILEFQDLISKKGFKLRNSISKLLLKRETNIGKINPIIDREFDYQLNKAIDLLNQREVIQDQQEVVEEN